MQKYYLRTAGQTLISPQDNEVALLIVKFSSRTGLNWWMRTSSQTKAPREYGPQNPWIRIRPIQDLRQHITLSDSLGGRAQESEVLQVPTCLSPWLWNTLQFETHSPRLWVINSSGKAMLAPSYEGSGTAVPALLSGAGSYPDGDLPIYKPPPTSAAQSLGNQQPIKNLPKPSTSSLSCRYFTSINFLSCRSLSNYKLKAFLSAFLLVRKLTYSSIYLELRF